MLIADSSFIYALFNADDYRHDEALEFALKNRQPTLVPDVVLPETAYLFRRDFGSRGLQKFLQNFREYDAPMIPILKADLPRMQQIAETYADARFDIVDCCIMALCERLDVQTIATFDRRDFGVFRPRHCDFLALRP